MREWAEDFLLDPLFTENFGVLEPIESDKSG